jgi:chromosome segregation ATPase
VKKLAIHCHEIQDVKYLLSEINTFQEEKAQLEEQIENLEARCDSLLKYVAELKQKADRDAELEQAFTEAEDKNKELQEYIKKLVERDCSKHCDSYGNKGKTYNKVSYTQQRRKLKELKSNAEKTLWLHKTFGFEIDKLCLFDASGVKVDLDYSGIKKSGYQFLTEEEKDIK